MATKTTYGLELYLRMLRGEEELPPSAQTLGYEYTQLGVGYAELVWKPKPERFGTRLTQEHGGSILGGIIGAVADAAAGVAAHTTVNEEHVRAATVSATYKIRRTVTNQPVKFVAQVTNRGRQLIDVKCEIRELENNKYVGELTASCLVVNPQEHKTQESIKYVLQDT
jgi:acyl-coenzyme A thioesterase PaaI-like protein